MTEVQDLYLKVRFGYEKIILNNDEGVELQDIAFSLWKLHYKHIDEFRKRLRQTSANSESTNSSTLLNVANLQSNRDCHRKRFKLALLATYVGDDYIALYHCIRSLAIKEPFPDAWDNLILLFEKVISFTFTF
ncbi:Protein SMG7L [Camellia lanceoleosa]|uniref:Protein SMG7L n=1 Tax=Camellia lanceoleosa TaxID=1840588 RepID=A0ACC0FGC5_9ERIC|nr:Protein SMG7L [Camellia lanceoleosa]